MLTADLVIVRRRKSELILPDLRGKAGESVQHWAREVLDTARECLGEPREQYTSLVSVMGETTQERKLARGLAKLVEDGCTFEESSSDIPAQVRSQLFLRSTQARRAATSDAPWDRERVVREACAENTWEESTVEDLLYADLPGAQRLLSVPEWTAETLADLYDASRLQAVLLRSVEVRVSLTEASPRQLRELFRQLKFRRLLHRSERAADGSLCLTIDGPYSLFDSVTKYGLQMALIVPALRAVQSFDLSADLQWGASRARTQFSYKYRASKGQAAAEPHARAAESSSDELEQLLRDLAPIRSRFHVQPASSLVDFPGIGLCLPDLTFTDSAGEGRTVHFELLGYWSRDSVWKRVELVEAGLPEPILFGVNQRLRVSEEVLDADASGALYVFRGQPNAKTLLQRIEDLSLRPLEPKLALKVPVPRKTRKRKPAAAPVPRE